MKKGITRALERLTDVIEWDICGPCRASNSGLRPATRKNIQGLGDQIDVLCCSVEENLAEVRNFKLSLQGKFKFWMVVDEVVRLWVPIPVTVTRVNGCFCRLL